VAAGPASRHARCFPTLRMLRLALLGLVVAWAVSILRLARRRHVPASAPLDRSSRRQEAA